MAAALSSMKASSHGLRGPPASAIAPRTGLVTAISSAASTVIRLQSVVPSISLGATTVVT